MFWLFWASKLETSWVCMGLFLIGHKVLLAYMFTIPCWQFKCGSFECHIIRNRHMPLVIWWWNRWVSVLTIFSARFCWLLSLLQESPYGKEMMFISSKLGLNKNINEHFLSVVTTCERFLTQGQFRNVTMFEAVF